MMRGSSHHTISSRKTHSRFLRALAPWTVSGCVHLLLALAIGLGIFATGKVVTHISESYKPSFVPTSFDDPGASPDGVVTGMAGDPASHAAANRLRDILPQHKEEIQAGAGKSLSAALAAGDTDTKAYAIGFGNGGKVIGSGGTGDGGSLFGTPGGANRGPRATFYGTTGNAMKIVYVIDRTGSLVDQWRSGVQREVKASVNKLMATQAFAVITFTSPDAGGAQIVGKWTAMHYATRENKNVFTSAFDSLPCQGGDADEYEIFKNAFELAFSLRPQQIFFLTDGLFDARLLETISQMNKGNAVKISTVAFTVSAKSNNPTTNAIRKRMRQLAEQNGGVFKEIGGE